MADWKKLAKAILLADGAIDEREVAALRKELFADGRIDDIELEFLLDLRHSAKGVKASFNVLVLDALKNCLLADGSISAGHAGLLRRWIFADGKVDADEKHWLKELKLLADRVSPEFLALYNECLAS